MKNISLEWFEIAREVGEAAFSRALMTAVRNSEWFPSVAAVRRFAGLAHEQLEAAECDVGWAVAKAYAKALRNTNVICGRHENGELKYLPEPEPPAQRVLYAIEAIGGPYAIRKVDQSFDVEGERFLRRDFNAAFARFPSHQIVGARLDRLALANSAVEPKRLTQ